jgi:hypothetical protein
MMRRRGSDLGAAAAMLAVIALAAMTGQAAPTTAHPAGGRHRPSALGQASASARALAANPRISFTARARRDLRSGTVDPRLVRVLAAATGRHRLAVSVFATGHSKYVAGTWRVSRHYSGRAADVWQVDGRPVTAANPAARRLVAWLAALPPSQRPAEVGSPFAEFEPLPGFFTDRAHRDHVHIGVGRRPGRGR